MPYEFTISRNHFLLTSTKGYFNRYYTGYQQPDNPDFLNTLKNTFNNTNIRDLTEARNMVSDVFFNDVIDILFEHRIPWTCICVPRAKSFDNYTNRQLMFCEGIQNAIKKIINENYVFNDTEKPITIVNGIDNIVRIINTKTTHIKKETESYINDGELPYPGITKETCRINKNEIKGKNIILVDDIYTNNVNIDEDCIQALYDNGANSVIFYALAYTRRN